MSDLSEIERQIGVVLDAPAFSPSPAERHAVLLPLLKTEIAYACDRNPGYRNYVEQWPVDFRAAGRIAGLPYLPVGVFKANPPLSLVDASAVKRTLTSSATTGQVPSRVVLDAATSKRMTRGLMTIIRDFIGAERRPYLIIDTSETLSGQAELGARGAAIQGLRLFATEWVCCLGAGENGDPRLDEEKLLQYAAKWRNADVLVYGFTYVIWNQLVLPLKAKGIRLDLSRVHVLHSGGWKRLEQQAVTREVFIAGVASTFGCAPDRVIDFYGMVENVGVVYPDCAAGYKHVPAFAEVIVRNPLTLEPVNEGQQGLVQVCSILPTSFPGFLVLTEDMGEVIAYDGCSCGRRGTAFRFLRRVPKAEARGCGNVEPRREKTILEVAARE